MTKLIKMVIFVVAVSSIAFSASIGMIDGHRITGTDKRQHAALCNAVIAVRCLKRQRADNYLSWENYTIRVKNILTSLRSKGLRVW